MSQQIFLDGTSGVKLGNPLSQGALTATLSQGSGALFPALTGGNYYLLTLATSANPETAHEVIKVTAVNGDVLTISQRAVEGSDIAWSAGDKCESRVSATPLNGFAAIAANPVVAEMISVIGTSSVTTATDATSGSTVAPASYPCTAMYIPPGRVALEYQRNGAGDFAPIRADEGKLILGITNANQIGFRRADYATPTDGYSAFATFAVQIVLQNTTANYSVSHSNATTSTNASYQSMNDAICSSMSLTNAGKKDVLYTIFGWAQSYGNKIDDGSGSGSAGVIFTPGTVFSGQYHAGQTLSGGGTDGTKIVSDNGDGTFTVDTSQYNTDGGVWAGQSPGILLKTGSTVEISGITNAKQIAIVSTDSIGNGSVSAELFQGNLPKLKLRDYTISQVIGRNAFKDFGEASYPQSVLTQESFGSFTKFDLRGDMITLFNLAANTVATGPAVVDQTLAGQETVATNPLESYNKTGLAQAYTGNDAGTLASSINTPIAIDVTGKDIHYSLKSIGTVGPQSLELRIYSEGTYDAPSANYHSLTGCRLTPSYGYAGQSSDIAAFVAVGSGADLTAIKYALFAPVGANGAVLRPELVKAVTKAEAYATISHGLDDDHALCLAGAIQDLTPYGGAALLFPSPAAGALSSGGETIDDILAATINHGFRVGTQDWQLEGSRWLNPDQWMESQHRIMAWGASFGFDLEGLRDSSSQGGPNTYITDEQRKMSARISATYSAFQNGSGVLGAAFTGGIAGNLLTVDTITDTASPIRVGMILVGTGVDDTTKIAAFGTGAGGVGTYTIVSTQNPDGQTIPDGTSFAADDKAPLDYCETNPPGDPWNIPSFNWDGSFQSPTTANYWQYCAKFRLHIDQAIANKGICSWRTHTGFAQGARAAMQWAMAYAVRKGLPIRPITDIRIRQSTNAKLR